MLGSLANSGATCAQAQVSDSPMTNGARSNREAGLNISCQCLITVLLLGIILILVIVTKTKKRNAIRGKNQKSIMHNSRPLIVIEKNIDRDGDLNGWLLFVV